MPNIISLEAALEQGVSAASTLAVARWHEERSSDCARAIKAKKRLFGDIVTQADVDRHNETAKRLRTLAKQIAEKVS